MSRIFKHILLFCLALMLFGESSYGIAKAGTSIESQAEMFFEGGLATSETSAMIVFPMHGITLEPNSTGGYSNAGRTYYFSHSVTNVGNSSENLHVSIVTATPETWSFSLIQDENGNCSHESGENTTLESSVLIAEEAKMCFFVAVTVPPGETSGNSGSCTFVATIENADGGYYYGANGTIYGGPDTAEATDILTVEGIFNLKINRDDSSNKLFITWDGGPGDIYRIDDSYDDSFAGSVLEASSATSPYYCSTLEVKDGKARFYRAALTGTFSYAPETVGKFDVPVNVGINQLSSPFILYSNEIKNIVGPQVVGSSNSGDADRLWKYNPSVPGEFEIAWLVDGIGPPYDGTWYTGNYPTNTKLGTDEGWYLQIREDHPATYITLIGEVSRVNRAVSIEVGMSMVGSCFPVAVSFESSNLYYSGLSGGPNAFIADRVWTFNSSTEGQFDISWLVDGMGALDGSFYTGNYPTTMHLSPGKGYWVQVRYWHAPFTWDYTKPY